MLDSGRILTAKTRQPRRNRTTRDDILRAATEEFLVHGYRKTSITAIVTKVGGSTRNIYDYFSDKHGLLLAVLEHHSEGMVQRFIGIDPTNRSIEDYLRSFARGYLKAILDPQSMGFYRLAISESVRMPELPRIIMRSAQHVVVGRVAKYFDTQIEQGVMRPCDTLDMAEMFIALARDKMLMRAALDPARKITDAELDDFIAGAVDLFLQGILVRGPAVASNVTEFVRKPAG